VLNQAPGHKGVYDTSLNTFHIEKRFKQKL